MAPEDQIRELNLAYLLLAQQLIRENPAVAQLRLGVSSEVADLLARLSIGQVLQLARSRNLLCSFRIDSPEMLAAMAAPEKRAGIGDIHATILMTTLPVEQI